MLLYNRVPTVLQLRNHTLRISGQRLREFDLRSAGCAGLVLAAEVLPSRPQGILAIHAQSVRPSFLQVGSPPSCTLFCAFVKQLLLQAERTGPRTGISDYCWNLYKAFSCSRQGVVASRRILRLFCSGSHQSSGASDAGIRLTTLRLPASGRQLWDCSTTNKRIEPLGNRRALCTYCQHTCSSGLEALYQ